MPRPYVTRLLVVSCLEFSNKEAVSSKEKEDWERINHSLLGKGKSWEGLAGNYFHPFPGVTISHAGFTEVYMPF